MIYVDLQNEWSSLHKTWNTTPSTAVTTIRIYHYVQMLLMQFLAWYQVFKLVRIDLEIIITIAGPFTVTGQIMLQPLVV